MIENKFHDLGIAKIIWTANQVQLPPQYLGRITFTPFIAELDYLNGKFVYAVRNGVMIRRHRVINDIHTIEGLANTLRQGYYGFRNYVNSIQAYMEKDRTEFEFPFKEFLELR